MFWCLQIRNCSNIVDFHYFVQIPHICIVLSLKLLLTMHAGVCFVALWAALSLVQARPYAEDQLQTNEGLRLIKTSEKDPGTWVTEEDKITKYRARGINFVDITDIHDPETLALLSGDNADNNRQMVPAVTYPMTASHQDEANALIATANTDGPKLWLKTLSE